MLMAPQKGSEWELFFDGVSRSPKVARKEDAQDNVAVIRILFVFPDNTVILCSFPLTMGCSNNIAKYEVVIAGLELALQIPITGLTIYRDSELVVK